MPAAILRLATGLLPQQDPSGVRSPRQVATRELNKRASPVHASVQCSAIDGRETNSNSVAPRAVPRATVHDQPRSPSVQRGGLWTALDDGRRRAVILGAQPSEPVRLYTAAMFLLSSCLGIHGDGAYASMSFAPEPYLSVILPPTRRGGNNDVVGGRRVGGHHRGRRINGMALRSMGLAAEALAPAFPSRVPRSTSLAKRLQSSRLMLWRWSISCSAQQRACHVNVKKIIADRHRTDR